MNPKENITRRRREVHNCNSCDKTFFFNSSLIKHMRIHTGEKPYLCNSEGCYQRFSQVSNLIRHRRVHSGVKPYNCKICNKCFSSSSNLKQHLNIHKTLMKRSKFVCFIEDCTKSYLYICTLKKHIMFAHKKSFDQLLQSYPNKNFYEIFKGIKYNYNEYSNKFHFINFKQNETLDKTTLETEKMNFCSHEQDKLTEEGFNKPNKNIFYTVKSKHKQENNGNEYLDSAKNNSDFHNTNYLTLNQNPNYTNITNNYNCNNFNFINNQNINYDQISASSMILKQLEFERAYLMQNLINMSYNNTSSNINEYININNSNNLNLLNVIWNQKLNNLMSNLNYLNNLQMTNNENFNRTNINNYNINIRNPSVDLGFQYFNNNPNFMNLLGNMKEINSIKTAQEN